MDVIQQSLLVIIPVPTEMSVFFYIFLFSLYFAVFRRCLGIIHLAVDMLLIAKCSLSISWIVRVRRAVCFTEGGAKHHTQKDLKSKQQTG